MQHGGRQSTYHCSYNGKRPRSRDGSESAGNPHAGTDQQPEYTAAYGADRNLDRSLRIHEQTPLRPPPYHRTRGRLYAERPVSLLSPA